jgi:hypothetical protein
MAAPAETFSKGESVSDDQRSVRLGDVVDDYCSRCRLLMNHGVVGMVGVEIRKVRCNTCLSEHVFRHGKLPARRRNATDKLFAEVLKGIKPDAVPVPQEPAPDPPQVEAGADEPAAEAPPRPPAHPQRKLYTMRRAISDRDAGKNPKKS